MTRSASGRLVGLVAIGAAAVLLGIVTGRVELVALALPPLAVVLAGVSSGPAPAVSAAVRIEADRYVEGDHFDVTVQIEADRVGEVDIGLVLPLGVEPCDGVRRRTVLADPAPEVTFPLVARRWGAHRIGAVALRSWGPGRLVGREVVVDRSRVIKVYPRLEALRRSLVPEVPHLLSGDYLSRTAGHGIEFADVRPYTRGDTIRQINWRVTSRSGGLHVNLRHPERDADLVLFLDTFAAIDLGGYTTLDLTVRGAAALAHHHLRHNDRVALLGFGGNMRWLRASMGRTHAYRVADFLLDLQAGFSYAWKNIFTLPLAALPRAATVVVFSPLVDERTLRALVDMRARGWPLVVIDTLEENRVTPARGREGAVAYRAWRLHREVLKSELADAGIPVITWKDEAGIASVLGSVPRRRKRSRAAS